MKKYLTLFCVCCFLSTNAQLNSTFALEGMVGIRFNVFAHQDRVSGEAGSNPLISSPLIGIKIKHKKSPFSLSFMHDRSYLFRHYPLNDLYEIQEINKGNMIRLQYEAKKLRYGIGHYWFNQENTGDHWFPGLTIVIRKIAFAVAIPFGPAEIEYQSMLRYTYFDVGDWYLQELNIKYYFGNKKNKSQKYFTQAVKLNLLVGSRFFLPSQSYIIGESKAQIGTTGAIGVELIVPKIKTGLYWEKDWWIALNGGSQNREVKGQITNNIFGLKYHHPLKNKKSFNIGLGYAWILDASTLDKTRDRILEGKESKKLWENNIRGISISPSIDFNDKWRVELRQIIATEGERGIHLERLSLGVLYKINP